MRVDDDDGTYRAPDATGGGLCLLVSADGLLRTYPLPEAGEVTLGRGPDCGIRIEHKSVSRKHAILRMTPALEIEDLGSANGTRIQDRALVAGKGARLAVGEVVDLGSVMLVVRHAATRTVRIWPHTYFEGRLAEECERTSRSGETFAVLRLSVGKDAAVEATFAELLRPIDVVARYAPDEYELLLSGLGAEQASELLAKLAQHLTRQGVTARGGLACHPRDGATAERLIARACAALRGPEPAPEPGGGIDLLYDAVGPRMKTLLELVERVAKGQLSVLLSGETGVGKEVFAELVHRRSPRAEGTFLRLHCAAISETLLESELFGYERGAFTGAQAAKPGLLETADGGTVFLDEIGELPAAMQVKLLRVLEDRKITRIGGLKAKPIDVRFVAATNRDLAAEVVAGRFRRDLYFRLNGITLAIPPLRERRAEIEPLARHFARQASAQAGRATAELSNDALAILHAHAWPGNVRELKNTIERAVLLCGDGPVRAEHLADLEPARAPEAAPAVLSPAAGLREQIDTLERDRIEQALEECGGNQTRAAKLLGIARGTLIARMDAYGLTRPRKR